LTATETNILWRDTSGDVAIWLMNGTEGSAAGVANVPTIWSIVGTGDFNGDGTLCDCQAARSQIRCHGVTRRFDRGNIKAVADNVLSSNDESQDPLVGAALARKEHHAVPVELHLARKIHQA
jgi:hypothetical protein